MKQIRIALTGGIGSGKSTVAEMLESHGAHVVFGDQLGRAVLEEDEIVRDSVIAKLGSKVLEDGGKLNRSAIAKIVFSDRSLTSWLTHLTFPGIYTRWKELAANSNSSVIVFDAALVFEWGIENDFELVIVVSAERNIAVERSRSRFTESDFALRSSNQLPIEQKLARADIIIHNNGTREDLKQRIDRVWFNQISPLSA